MKEINVVNLPIGKILESPFQPRDVFEKEDIDQMGKNIKKIGLMNPITVRPYNGDYEIIAGGRRYRAAKALGEKEIQAKVVDADDIEAAIMGIAENYHRKDLTIPEKEKSIYAAWKKGRITIFKDMVSIMSEWTGVPLSTLTEIINAGKEKDASKSKIIQNATAKDLSRTRDLEGIAPDVRKELLKLKQSKIVIGESDPKLRQPKPVIGAMDLDNTVKAIKIAKNADISDEIIKDIPRLISTNKISPAKTEDLVRVVIDTPKDMRKDVIKYVEKEKVIDPDKMKALVDQLKQSPPDVQEKLLNKEIDIDDAKVASRFKTKEQREQIIEECKINKTAEDKNKKEFEKHLKTREKQAEEIVQGKDPTNLTKFDIEKLKQINANTPEEQDRRLLKIFSEARMNLVFKADIVKDMNLDASKKEAIEIIWQIYEHVYNVLLELEEIKVVTGTVNPRSSPVLPKH